MKGPYAKVSWQAFELMDGVRISLPASYTYQAQEMRDVRATHTQPILYLNLISSAKCRSATTLVKWEPVTPR